MADNKITRREFVERTAAVGAGLIGASLLGGSGQATAQQATAAGASRVIHTHSDGAFNLQTGQADYDRVSSMVQTGICQVTGKLDLAEAWRSLVSPDDVVGLKINCLGRPGFYNDHVLLRVLKEELVAVGVRSENIIAFDRYTGHLKGAGFTIGQQEDGSWLIATDGSGPGYDGAVAQEFPPHGKDTKEAAPCSKIVTQKISKMINIPILKNHGGAGVTLALKNIAFGIFNHTGSAHDNHCNPYIPYMCSHPVVRQKTVLHILDGLKGQYEGGPGGKAQFQWAQQSILMSPDPVALDFIGAGLINQARQQNGKSPISNGHMSHIFTGAQIGLGHASAAEIEEVLLTI